MIAATFVDDRRAKISNPNFVANETKLFLFH
jgi:hypothetical protein